MQYQVLVTDDADWTEQPCAYTEPRDTFAEAQKDLRAARMEGLRNAYIASTKTKSKFFRNPFGHRNALVVHSQS